MSSERRSPWWPYLIVLAGLFMLSLAVPRGWQSEKLEAELQTVVARRSANTKPRVGGVKAVIVRPNQETGLESLDSGGDVAAFPTHGLSLANAEPTTVPAFPKVHFRSDTASRSPQVDSAPIVETVAEKLTQARQYFGNQAANRSTAPQLRDAQPNIVRGTSPLPRQPVAEQRPADADNLASPTTTESPDSKPTGPSNPTLADRASPEMTPPGNTQSETKPSDLTSSVPTWPLPARLLEQLDELSTSVECRAWAGAVRQRCQALAGTAVDQASEALAIIKSLDELAGQSESILGQLREPITAARFRRTQYALQRRLDTWRLVAECGARPATFASVADGEQQRRRLSEAYSKVIEYLESIPHSAAWAKYLALDDVSQLISAGAPPVDDAARIIARRTLVRLAPSRANAEQRRVLSHATIESLAGALKPIAAQPIDRHELLTAIEAYESNRLTSGGRVMTVAQQNLLWSSEPMYGEIAQSLENHYRNANVRVALTAELLNRLAPEPVTTFERVNDTIMGTPVRGQSVNTTEIRVKLIPDPHRVHFWLEACGVVDSHTKSTSGPATLINRGASDFLVRKALILDRSGLTMAQASTEADSRSQLSGVRTDFDGIPIVGPIVRNYAESQYDAMREQARWESRQKIAARAGQRVDAEVKQRVEEAEERVRREILLPIAGMDLELEPITLETLSDRATMRLRLAGANQLGGHTARPQAPSDSLASVQLHESAINNLLDQLQLAGRTFDLPGLYRHLAQRLSRPEPKLPDDLPEGVQITFADSDPVRVYCEDDLMRLTLSIKSLSQGTLRWHDFTISTTYKPQADGRKAELTRDGIIELSGEAYKGKTELRLRTIFAKILSRERSFPLLPPLVAENPQLADVCVTQLTIEDGWIGLALGPDRTAVRSGVARRPGSSAK